MTETPEIDFSLALGDAPRRGRGRPKKITQDAPGQEQPKRVRGRPKGTGKGATFKTPDSPLIDTNNNLGSEDAIMEVGFQENNEINSIAVKGDDGVQLKDKLTLKELNFLELYFAGGYTIEKAVIAAGYESKSQRYLYRVAAKIVQKYEQQGSDTRKIFQEIGFGQVKIAQGIKNLAEKAKSEMVRLNALALAAKCCRMTSEPESSHTGISITINTGPSPGEPGHPGQPPPRVLIPGEPISSTVPRKPLQITR